MPTQTIHKLLFVLLCILLISNASAIIPEGSIKLLAVTPDGTGTEADLTISIVKGSGRIWSSVDALVGTSTQNTEKTAVELLKKYGSDFNNYDYFFAINSTAKMVDGPSAGVPTALLLIYLFTDKQLPDYVSGTGTISSGGQIGKIGGILEKTKYASSTGIKVFFVPKSELDVVVKESDEVKKVNLSTYALSKWNIKVIGVDSIDDILNYNLNDINTIKIADTKTEEKPIYDPPIIDIENNLNQFGNYLKEYLDEVNKNIALVESTLKDIDLKDNDLLTELYSTLTEAKQFYKEGSIAYEKKYLYSSANNLFRANVDLGIIYDLATNQEILNNPQKLTDLANSLNKNYLFDFNKIPCNNYEWYIAGEERYLWAKKQIEIVLTSPGVDIATNLKRLYSYEEAKEWLKIAKLFTSYSQSDNCYLNQKPYKDSSDNMLGELKKAESLIEKYDLTESNKWIDGAKDANANEWYLTSIFESATALATINSYLDLKDENFESTKKLAKNIIDDLENQNTEFVWTNLYLQHSKYFYGEAEFYELKDNNANALESYKNAYQLGLFAKNLQQVVEDIEKNKQSITYIANNNNIIIDKTIGNWDPHKKIAVLLISIVLILVIIIILFYRKMRKNHLSQYVYSIDSKITQIKSLLIKLENEYRNGKISTENFKSTINSYSREIEFLEAEKRLVQNKIQEITTLETQISNKHRLLNELKSKYSHNLISLNDYLRTLKEYDYEIKTMKSKINSDYKTVSNTVVKKETRIYSFKPTQQIKKKRNLSDIK